MCRGQRHYIRIYEKPSYMSSAPMGACNGAVAVLREMENIPMLEAMHVIVTFT